MTLHFRDRENAALRAKITVLKCEQWAYQIRSSCLRESHSVWCKHNLIVRSSDFPFSRLIAALFYLAIIVYTTLWSSLGIFFDIIFSLIQQLYIGAIEAKVYTSFNQSLFYSVVQTNTYVDSLQ